MNLSALRRRRISILSIVAAASVTVVLTLVQQWYYLRHDLADDFNSFSKIIATNANAALAFNDQAAGRELLSSLVHSPYILEAVLYRVDGTMLAHYAHLGVEPSPVPANGLRAAFGSSFSLSEMLIHIPIQLDERPVGSLLVRVSQREIYENLAFSLVSLVVIIASGLAIAHLVTRRLRRRIDETERLFDSFFNSSPAGMAIVDMGQRMVRINRTLAEINGLSAEDHIGRKVDEVTPGLSQSIGAHHLAAVRTGRDEDIEISGNSPGRPGEMRYWLNTFFPLRDIHGNIVASGCVVIDITERHKTEQARREADARLRSVTTHLPVLLFQLELDDELRFKYIGEGAFALLGGVPWRLTTESGQIFGALRTEDAARLAGTLARARAAAPGTLVNWSGCFERGPRRGKWIEMRASVTATEEGPVRLSGVLQDVTQLRQAEEQNAQSRQLLQQLAMRREQMIDEEHKRISLEIHDQIGQLLTAALMQVRVLGRAQPSEGGNARQTIATIESLLNEAYRSIKDIAASLRPAVLNFGFRAAAEWAVERALKNTSMTCSIQVEQGLPPLDERQSTTFFRILQEALSNCVRHADAGHVTVSLAAQGGELVLTIADDGRGMEGDLPQSGLSFGLFGIQERALALGGTASISGLPGKGVTVKVVVPLTTSAS